VSIGLVHAIREPDEEPAGARAPAMAEAEPA